MLTGECASVKGAVLNWFNEGRGVKQGDPAGPRMFVTYIHDLPECVCPDDPWSRKLAVFLINQIVRCIKNSSMPWKSTVRIIVYKLA